MFIHSFNHWFLSPQTRVHLFCTLGNDPTLPYLFHCSKVSSFGHWGLFQISACVSLTYPHSSAFFWALPELSGTTRCSGLVLCFPAPALESVIPPRIPVFFCGKWHLETKIRMLGMFLITGGNYAFLSKGQEICHLESTLWVEKYWTDKFVINLVNNSICSQTSTRGLCNHCPEADWRAMEE